MNKSRKQYIESCEVSELLELSLGGYSQKVLIEGKTRNLPVVIFLHGGPGSPVPFSVGCRGLFPEWTTKAVMVFWDQLGCGKNNYKIDDGFTIDSFVDMTVDLVNEIKARFPENRLYLFGISWGSILALKSALRVPEALSGVITYGQFLKNCFFSEEVRSAFSSAPAKVKREINDIISTGADCDYKVLDRNLKKLFKYLNKFTNAYNNKNSEPMKTGEIVKGLLTSPDYTFKDFTAVVNNGYRGNQSLWRELMQIDLAGELAKISVPYYLMQGDTDIVTSTEYVSNVVQSSGNNNLSCTVIKNSGHMPSNDAMREIFDKLCEIIG